MKGQAPNNSSSLYRDCPVNRSSFNQDCRRALQLLKQAPDPSYPHCLQLAQWALDQWPELKGDSRLPESMDAMIGWQPEIFMNYLTMYSDLESLFGETKVKTAAEAEQLANEILMVIHDNLTALIPDYPSMSLQRSAWSGG